MAFRVVLERLYPDMKEATVGRWLKAEGEAVAEGDPIAELITDKVTFALESPGAGRLRRIYAREKSVLPIGCTLAVLASPEEALPDIEAENRALIAAREAEVARGLPAPRRGGPRVRPALVAGVAGPGRADGVRATPSARRLARERGIDLARVPRPERGPITERDVEAFISGR
ncbi:MAG: E3 binding domain-containing protein [Armatimonadetes bacterium]|nr:E3 binding domain-containing protein [Armatimonadota bacterium]